MAKVISFVLILIVISAGVAVSGTQPIGRVEKPVKDEYIVVLDDAVSATDVATLSEQLAATVGAKIEVSPNFGPVIMSVLPGYFHS